jgi:hypothetical protein
LAITGLESRDGYSAKRVPSRHVSPKQFLTPKKWCSRALNSTKFWCRTPFHYTKKWCCISQKLNFSTPFSGEYLERSHLYMQLRGEG